MKRNRAMTFRENEQVKDMGETTSIREVTSIYSQNLYYIINIILRKDHLRNVEFFSF